MDLWKMFPEDLEPKGGYFDGGNRSEVLYERVRGYAARGSKEFYYGKAEMLLDVEEAEEMVAE
jgi:hypothetical protein